MQSPTNNFHGWLIVAPGVPGHLLISSFPDPRGWKCEWCGNEVDLYRVTPSTPAGLGGSTTCHGCLVASHHHQRTTGEVFYQPSTPQG